ncbi:hypothetical protein GCM10022409_20200 [Hymenobacter glaciei]|uniref:Uncharacterized protein n=1 Tax=Hymenobacter glaciei TaxID=877209 RepID=A0ABP7U463_9BACT
MEDSILRLVKEAHAIAEASALAASDAQQRKQFILADLSLHLVQAALRVPQPDEAELKRYLFGVLTVANGFVEDVDLKAMAERLMAATPQT